MTNSDQRPKPQFGEYATPEEQHASIQVPQDVSHPEPVPIPAGRLQPPAAPHPHGQTNARPGATPNASRAGDRIATVALLAIGLLNVVMTVPGLLNLSATLDSAFKQMGIGSFTPTPLAAGIGIGLVIFYAAAWLATLALTARRLRTGRLSFWIPLLAGVVVTVVAMICFLVLFFGDSAFIDYAMRNAS